MEEILHVENLKKTFKLSRKQQVIEKTNLKKKILLKIYLYLMKKLTG